MRSDSLCAGQWCGTRDCAVYACACISGTLAGIQEASQDHSKISVSYSHYFCGEKRELSFRARRVSQGARKCTTQKPPLYLCSATAAPLLTWLHHSCGHNCRVWLYMHRISISIMLLLMALARLQTVASICSHEFRCAFARESQTLPM